MHWLSRTQLGPLHVLASLTPRRQLALEFQHAVYAPAGPAARLLAKVVFAAGKRQ